MCDFVVLMHSKKTIATDKLLESYTIKGTWRFYHKINQKCGLLGLLVYNNSYSKRYIICRCESTPMIRSKGYAL